MRMPSPMYEDRDCRLQPATLAMAAEASLQFASLLGLQSLEFQQSIALFS